MTRTMKLWTALLACITIANGVPAPFPREKILVYDYRAEVKAGILEPASHSAQYVILGKMLIEHDATHVSPEMAYIITLTNITTDIHNGRDEKSSINDQIPIEDTVKVLLEKPFLMVYNEMGLLHGVKISEDEAGWSQNIKLAMASMLQLNITNIQLNNTMNPNTFITHEKTIYGDCITSYDVRSINTTDNFIINKFTTPMDCSDFNIDKFNRRNFDHSDLINEESIKATSIKTIEIENQAENLLIKSLVAHGIINYQAIRRKTAEPYQILNQVTMTLVSITAATETPSTNVDFTKMPTITDLRYRTSKTSIAEDTVIDITQGRRIIHQHTLIVKIKKLLHEAMDYLEAHQLEVKEVDFHHSLTINKMMDIMKFMELSSMEQIFAEMTVETPRDMAMMQLFIGILSQTGTNASWKFAMKIIETRQITDMESIEILTMLSTRIHMPTESHLAHMFELILFEKNITYVVRKSMILAWSTIINRIYKDDMNLEENITLNEHLKRLMQYILKDDTTQEMKMVYLMAFQNIQLRNIPDFLTPMLHGNVNVDLRLMALLAMRKTLISNYNNTHELLYPILIDDNSPLTLRITAYDILIQHAPHSVNMLKIHWYMMNEKNQHMYNYHYTTMKNFANTVDARYQRLRDSAIQIMRLMKIPNSGVPHKISASYMIDAIDEVYDRGVKLWFSIIYNEYTGNPELIHLKHDTIEEYTVIEDWQITLNLKGMDGVTELLMPLLGIHKTVKSVTNENIMDMLKKLVSNMSPKINPHFDLILCAEGRVVYVNHYSKNSMMEMYNDIRQMFENHLKTLAFTKTHIIYQELVEHDFVSELGVPIMIETKIPLVNYFDIDFKFDTDTYKLNLLLNGKLWRHGEYSMSIYNPLLNIWHSVRRSIAIDFSYPIEIIASFDPQTYAFNIVLPRKSDSKSTIGFRAYAKDFTVITAADDDDGDIWKKMNITFHHREMITHDLMSRKNFISTIESDDLGIDFIFAIYETDDNLTPVELRQEWRRALMIEHKNTWDNWMIRMMFAARQQIKNFMLCPISENGILMVIQSHTINPMSRININWSMNRRHLSEEGKISEILVFDAISAHTNESARKWEFNMTMMMSHGIKEMILIEATRSTTDEIDRIINIKGEINYPNITLDQIRHRDHIQGEADIEFMMEMKIKKDDTTPAMSIVMNAKEELTAERKGFVNNDSMSIVHDWKDLRIDNSGDLVALNSNHLKSMRIFNIMRKYNIEFSYNQMPQSMISTLMLFEDMFLSIFLPHIEYTNERSKPGTLKMDIEFQIKHNIMMNMSVITPLRSYNMTDIEVESEFYRNYNSDKMLMNELATPIPIGMSILQTFIGPRSICTIQSSTTVNFNDEVLSVEIPNKWILMSGNYVNMDFAIFVKKSDNNLNMMMHIWNETVEIDDVTEIQANGKRLDSLNRNPYFARSEGNSWTLKVMKNNERIIVTIREIPLIVLYTTDNVSILLGDELKWKIMGLCGPMDDKIHITEIPKIYHLT